MRYRFLAYNHHNQLLLYFLCAISWFITQLLQHWYKLLFILLFLKLIFIGVLLLYNVVLAATAQQNGINFYSLTSSPFFLKGLN